MAFGNTNSILSSLIKNQNSNSSFKELKIWQGSEDEYNSGSIKPYYAWANNDNLIFTKTLDIKAGTDFYSKNLNQLTTTFNGTPTGDITSENGLITNFNGNVIKMNVDKGTGEMFFYSKVSASDTSREHQIMGLETEAKNIGRDNSVWRLWNGSGHYGSSFTIDTTYWVCFRDNFVGNYIMYVLQDDNYTKDTLPDLSEWRQEFNITNQVFFTSFDCVIGGGYSDGTVSESWTGTIDMNNTWFERNGEVIWKGTVALSIKEFQDNQITLSDGTIYARKAESDISHYNNIGQDHPDYLCFINNIGIKINDTYVDKNS